MVGRKGLSGGKNRRPDTIKAKEGRRVAAKLDAPNAPRSRMPKPPDHLTDAEQATWKAVTASLPKQGRYDPALLEAYVAALSAQRQMMRDGLSTPQRLRAFISLTNLLRQCAAEIQLAAERAPAAPRQKTEAETQAEQMQSIISLGNDQPWMLRPDGTAYGDKAKRSTASRKGSKPNGHAVDAD